MSFSRETPEEELQRSVMLLRERVSEQTGTISQLREKVADLVDLRSRYEAALRYVNVFLTSDARDKVLEILEKKK